MATNEYLQLMVDQFSDAIICCSSNGEIETWNRSAEALLGYQQDEMLGRSAYLTIPVKLMAVETEIARRVLAGERMGDYVTARIHADGHLVEVTVAPSIINNYQGSPVGVAFAIRPYTEADRVINRLQRSAFVDQVTQTLNRAGLEATLDRHSAREYTGLTALLFLDLDGFKRVNDVGGHRQGDSVLAECAGRIKNCIRQSDAVGRWGGDEFVILLHDLPTTEAAAAQTVDAICRNLLNALRLPYLVSGNQYRCPASIGAVVYDRSKVEAPQALELADQAMYLVKKTGKNGYQLYLDRSSREFSFQEATIRQAAVA